MIEVSAADFKKQTGLYQDMAMREPIAITKHNRPSYVLLSFDDYQKLTGQNQRALLVSELSAEKIHKILNSKMSAEHNHLNDEMDD